LKLKSVFIYLFVHVFKLFSSVQAAFIQVTDFNRLPKSNYDWVIVNSGHFRRLTIVH